MRSTKWNIKTVAVGLALLACAQSHAQTDESPLVGAALRGPAVAAILDAPRETPAQQVLAMLTLLDLGEDDLAIALWSELGPADLGDEVCAAIANQFGTARMLSLARRETEATEEATEEAAAQFAGARVFVDRCLKMASERARDPQRIAKLIADLNDPSDQIRRAARVDLAATGTVGAAACLEALAQTEDESVRANLMFGLTSLHPEINPLLLAALADGRGHFRRDVAELAGYLRVVEATPWLAAVITGSENDPAVSSVAIAALNKMDQLEPTGRETQILLRNEIQRLEQGVSADYRPVAEELRWWTFDATAGKFSALDVPADDWQLLAVARLARTLAKLPEATRDDQYGWLIYAYQVAELLGNEPSAATQEFAASLGADRLSEALAKAIKENKVAAAIACAKLLGNQAGSKAFQSAGIHPSPLAAAVDHADRELRYVALEAIMKLSPQKTFAGASNVPRALWEFAAGAGAPEAIAASLIAVRGSEWAAQLRERGFDATPTTSGSQALAIAIESARLALILVDSDIGRPQLREVIYQLRSHSRTGRIPIAILSSTHNLAQSRRIADHNDRLIAVPRPHDPVAMDEIVSRLTELGQPQPSPERRSEQALQALTWIDQLLAEGHPYDELHRGAAVLQETIYMPELLEPSLRALTTIGTAGSQQTLLDLVSQNSQQIELRRRAAEAFAASVENFGKQLTPLEIRRQYERYNASETADEETQQVLGQLLDVLEGKNLPATNPEGPSP